MAWIKELDEAAEMATRRGHWHIVLFYSLCGLAAIPSSFLVFSQVFTNATPEHWCAPPEDLESTGLPELFLRNITIPVEHGGYETCKTYLFDTTILLKTVGERYPNLDSYENSEDRNKKLQDLQSAITDVRKEISNCSNGWKFSKEHYEKTLVTEFSLVCDKDWLPRTSNTLFWVGSIFGNLLFGWMSDRYGRRSTILIMILFEVPIAIAASFSNSYLTYTALRVAGGLFFPALYQLPFVLALELMPPTKRTYTGIVVGMLFASGMCLLALLAFIIRDWYYLSLATSVPFVLLFGYYWLIPESPRWLVGKGRVVDAERVYRALAKKNGIILPVGFLMELHKTVKEEDFSIEDTSVINEKVYIPAPQLNKEESNNRTCSNNSTFPGVDNKIGGEVLNLNNMMINRITTTVNPDDHEAMQLKPDKENFVIPNGILSKRSLVGIIKRKSNVNERDFEDCKVSSLDLFRYPNVRKKFVLLTFNWVALGVVYNSISYNTPNLGVDDYLAFFIGGAVELPSYFIAWFSMERYGRRWVLFTFLSVGGVSCLCCAFVPETWPWVTVALAMMGRLCAAASFAVFYVQIGEMLPTVVRSQAMGASSFIAGIGLLTCPYIVHLAVHFKSLPLIVMGILSMVAGITSLFLPETLNQPLPQTLEDGELFGRNFKIFSFVKR